MTGGIVTKTGPVGKTVRHGLWHAGPMKITGARFIRVEGRLREDLSIDNGRGLVPADNDPAYATRPLKLIRNCFPDEDGVRRIRGTFLQLETDEGITGTCTQFGPGHVRIIRDVLLPYMIGRDPLAIEENWDFMFRLLCGRGLNAASAMNNAMWDIRGKLEGVPVYELLGGPKQDGLQPYAGTAGLSAALPGSLELARRLKEEGFAAQKWYPTCSTGHGPDGMDTNMEIVKALRETVGDDIDLMFDAHQGWTPDYAVEMAKRMSSFKPRWLEEPVMSDDIEGYRAVHEAADFPIAGSEAHQNRWQALALLKSGAVDVIQPDAGGTGGITEWMRIAKMTADHGKQIVIHCGYLPVMHFVAAQPRELCPYYEYLVNWNEYGQWFYRQKCEPVNGRMPLPPGPGLGLELDDDRIDTRQEV